MPMYEYSCDECGDWAEELRPYDDRDKPLPCTCEKGMMRVYQLTTYVCIKDQKWWPHPRTGVLMLKKRKRVLGTDIGRIRIDKLANEVHDMEKKYKAD